MRDVVLVILTIGFFLVTWWYVRGCERIAGGPR